MGNNYIIDNSFQLIRTNPLLTSNIQVVVDSGYKIYLESINSHKALNDDIYKHYKISKETYLEDKISQFYNNLSSNIVYSVYDDKDDNIVYDTYKNQFNTLYWGGVSKIKENNFYLEEFEYFAPLYVDNNDIPNNFIILRVDEPGVYELGENDKKITNTNKENFRNSIIDKWKCVSVFDMSVNSDFGYWLDLNYKNNPRFPITPLEFDSKKYNYTKWYGIDYIKGVYANKSVYMEDKLWYENPHFKFEKFLTENYKNNNLIFPNIINLKFLFDDTPASPFEYKKYSLNRYYGFYVDFELVDNISPYRTKSLISDLKIENNIFMSSEQITGSAMPFDIDVWDNNEKYYIYANKTMYEVIENVDINNNVFYKILSDIDVDIDDINRNCEIDIEFNEFDNFAYENQIIPRTKLTLDLDKYVSSVGSEELHADLYLININNKYHVLESKMNTNTNLEEYFIRCDYGIECDDDKLTYWLSEKRDENKDYHTINIKNDNDKPLMFPIYKIKFRDIKDFDFNRVDTGFADFDFDINDEYSNTSEHKLYTVEHRDSTDVTVFKKHDIDHVNFGEVMNVSSEYIATDELFEINKEGLSDIWKKNQSIVKWGFKKSISHSDYPYKLNNSNKVGFLYNRTTNIYNNSADVITKTHDYFYRIGNFYKSNKKITGELSYENEYYNNQTLSIETHKMKTDYFDLDKYINNNFDYFQHFFKNNRICDTLGNYEQTTHYSIFDGGDVYSPSTTLFKGIKYNLYGLSDIIRNDSNDLIERFITNKNNYNGYKFSVILNTIYDGLPTSDSVVTIQQEIPSKVPIKSTIIGFNDVEGINIFVNDKYKNILIIINTKLVLINQEHLTLNNTTHFDQRDGLYYNLTKDMVEGFDVYGNENLVASNYIKALNDLNNNIFSEKYIKYYGVGADTYTEYDMSPEEKALPSILIETDETTTIKTKKGSYVTASIKGPKFNIYDKYKTNFTELIYTKSFIKEPLSRYIRINEMELKPNIRFTKELNYSNTIYRYNGYYEPIFKDVELFKPIDFDERNGGFFEQMKTPSKIINDGDYNPSILIPQLEEEKDILEDKITYLENKISVLNDKKTYLEKYIKDEISILKIENEISYCDTLMSHINTQIDNLVTRLGVLNGAVEGVTNTNINWLFKDNVLNDNINEAAMCEFISGGDPYTESDFLMLGGFDFNIPSQSIIDGISFNMRRKSEENENDNHIYDSDIHIILSDGTNSIDIDYDEADITKWGTEEEVITYGADDNIYDLFTGNVVVNPQQINDKDFGIKISVSSYNLNGQFTNTAYLYNVEIIIHYTIDGVPLYESSISVLDKNTKFDTQLKNFGEINELIFSKVNEIENPLKMKDTDEDISIYPMVDEFGYQWDKRFIFKSTWDNDYYVRTKKDIE